MTAVLNLVDASDERLLEHCRKKCIRYMAILSQQNIKRGSACDDVVMMFTKGLSTVMVAVEFVSV